MGNDQLFNEYEKFLNGRDITLEELFNYFDTDTLEGFLDALVEDEENSF